MTVWRSLLSLKSRLFFIPLVTAAALAAFLSFALSKDRNVLWRIAHDKCVANEIQNNKPAPCAIVDISAGEADGYVLLKDIRGIAQYLLIPTRQISGIEAPEVLDPDLPNYWASAWSHRDLLGERLGHKLAWDKTALAINSQGGRSQDQMHIHIDCLRPDVRDALAAHSTEIGASWTKLAFNLAGTSYYARRLAAADLATQDPFKLLANGVTGARAAMGKQTLAMIGATSSGKNDFVLLAAPGPGDAAAAHSEDVMDHSCAVAQTQ